MLSKINSIRFASANTYTGQSKSPKTPYSQQSFGKNPSKTLSLIGAFIMSLGATGATATEKAAKKLNPKLDAICARCDFPPNASCIVDVPEQFLAPGGDIIKVRINKAALEAFKEFRATFKKERSVNLAIRSALQDDGYFDAVTKEMYRRAEEGGDLFLVDGLETHKSGCAMDVAMAQKPKEIISDILGDETTKYLEEDAKNFNLAVTNPDEFPQHLEFIPKK